MPPPKLPPWGKAAGRLKDLGITLLIWAYFTIGFVILFSPRYFFSFFFAQDRAAAFQALNSRFFQSFFALCRFLIPRQVWKIDPEISNLRSSVILCNHVSYLDSILLVSLFPRHTTIAKARLFAIPIFRRVLAGSGYIPSSSEGPYADLLLDSFDTLSRHLKEGGNIFVFPEGKRTRDGKVGPLYKGIFKIARHCKAPIMVLGIRNTEKLFEPGKFLFHTCRFNTIEVKRIAELHPDYETVSIKDLMARTAELLNTYMADGVNHESCSDFNAGCRPPDHS